ncbi:hypothetical protein [Bradyrhizobium sp. LMTR 3]|uniref:hypothetical protein n=1 Tax=Bradyrhizobium sp. LMTR 3 TaxID=189873 RepID=UPI0008105D17|nr:hypothetical protein [Bradyrhizobium sp. LMTR 3]OCK53878.1 hypothetical protein LMTR3_21995 [Bradyrhizobium sp. LMTR 3]
MRQDFYSADEAVSKFEPKKSALAQLACLLVDLPKETSANAAESKRPALIGMAWYSNGRFAAIETSIESIEGMLLRLEEVD